MPYEGEFAQYKPLQRLVESERVKKLLGSYKVRNKEDCLSGIQTLQPIKIQTGDWVPNWIISLYL